MDPEQSYFPVWVEDHPSDTELAAAFAAGHLPERLDADALPDGTEVMSADYRILGASIRLNSPEAFRARWKGLYFPGWSLRIDGQPAPIAPENNTGLITFEVPAGEHDSGSALRQHPAAHMGYRPFCAGLVLTGVVLARYLTPGQKQDHKETAVGEYEDCYHAAGGGFVVCEIRYCGPHTHTTTTVTPAGGPTPGGRYCAQPAVQGRHYAAGL